MFQLHDGRSEAELENGFANADDHQPQREHAKVRGTELPREHHQRDSLNEKLHAIGAIAPKRSLDRAVAQLLGSRLNVRSVWHRNDELVRARRVPLAKREALSFPRGEL